MNGNVAATIARGYSPILPHLMSASGEVAVCGAGPSLREHARELRGEVFAINSAIGYLLGEGIVPRWAMIWDCAELCREFAVPHPDVTYLVASRCHPAVFERLKDCRVLVWHACGDHNILEYLEEHGIMEPLVNGGTTGITRGIYLAYALGYRHLNLYGADSCYVGSDTHVGGASLVYEHHLPVIINGRWFDSTAQWAAQVEEMKIMYPMFRAYGGATMTVYGDGMLAWVMSIMQRDEAKALADAEALLELQARQKGAPGPGTPGVLPEGTISEIAQAHPDLAAPVMRTRERRQA